ncbi:MAG TPA: hypothetical protein VIW03_12245, partial [Anaeromyxobacter sp.]
MPARTRARLGRGFTGAAAALALAPGLAGADDLTGRGIVSYQGQDAATQSSSQVKQAYELRLQRHPSDGIEYRLRLRYEDDRGETVQREVRSSVLTRQLQPAGEVLVSLGTALLDAGYDFTWLDTAGARNPRQLDRVFVRGSVRPSGLPSVMVDAEQRTARDAAASLDQVDASLGFSVDHGVGSWRFRQSDRFADFEDRAIGFERRQVQLQASVGYETPADSRRLVGTVQLNGNANRMIENLLSGTPQDVPRDIGAARGLYGWDDTPADSTDRPLVGTPALVDGNLGAPAGISVGPDGLSFQNVGVDMGRFVQLDELRIYVRNGAGNPLPSDGLVGWTAWTSADGIAWVPAPASASSYYPPLGYYRVEFGETTARYFKAVSFGVNTLEAFVTEIQALVHERFVPTQERTSWNLLGSATANGTYRVSDRTALTYVGNSNLGRQRSPGAGALTSFDWDQTLGVTYRPASVVTLDARWQDRQVFPGVGERATTEVFAGTARVTPLAGLEHALGAGWQTERGPSRAVDSTFVTLRNYARLYPTLEVGLDAGYTLQQDAILAQRGERWSGAASTLARLTPDLTLGLNASWSRAWDTTAPIQAGRDDRYSADASWRASQQLTLAVRVGWVEASGATGWAQRYRLYWNPFPRGTIQVGLTYDEDVDSYTRQ